MLNFQKSKLRNFLGLVLISTLITACNPITPAVNIPAGQVVSCEKIKTIDNATSDLTLECIDGKSSVDLADISGPAVLNYWGTWCGPCRDEIPYFVDLNNALPKDLVLIGVNREEVSPADAIKFIEDFGITYPQLSDPTGLSKSLVGLSIPITVFISSDGQVAYTHVGAVKSVDELRELIRKHLGI